MDRYRSILLSLTLMLMQVLSPWVHAHVGQETGGSWHLPGLERINALETESAMPVMAEVDPDVIVVMQTGTESGCVLLRDAHHAEALGLPVHAGLNPPPFSVAGQASSPMGEALIKPPIWRSGTPPRASPG